MAKFNKFITRKYSIIIFISIGLSFLLFSSSANAEKNKIKNSDKKQMPVMQKGSPSVKVQVQQKNAKAKKQGNEKESSDGKKGDKESDDKKDVKNKDEKKKDKKDKGKTEKTVVQDQGKKSEKNLKRSKLESIVEEIIGREIDKSNKNDKKLMRIWQKVLDQGYSLQDIKSAVEDEKFSLNKVFVAVGLSLKERNLITAQGTLTPVQKALISAYVTKVLGKFNQGFYSYWVEQARKKGFNYVKQMLKNHYELEPYVEDLIGEIDYLDKKYNDNGFISYWSEQARDKGLSYIKSHLTIWKKLLPHIEEAEGRKLNLYNPDDSGIVGYWANEVEKLIDEGMSLENAVQEIIKEIQKDEPEIPDDIKDALVPYVEELLEVTFDENDEEQMGFLSYWANKVIEGDKTLEEVTSLLDNMVNIKSEVENLIGDIDFLDDKSQDDGFITYWANEVNKRGLDTVKRLLVDMNTLKPILQRAIGRNLNPFNDQDSGILSYWANQVSRLMQEGMNHTEAIEEVKKTIKDTFNIQGDITFYMNNDKVSFFDEDGNVIYEYELPEDTGNLNYKPLYTLISADDGKAVIVWNERTANVPPKNFFHITKIDLKNGEEKNIDMNNKRGKIKDVQMTPNGKHLMIGYVPSSLPGRTLFVDIENSTMVADKKVGGGPDVTCDMLLSPDSNRLYVISDKGYIQIYSPHTGEELATIETSWYEGLTGTEQFKGKLYISDDGKILTIVDKDGNEVKYNVEDLDNIYQIEEIPDDVKEALIPYIEGLIGSYDEDNPQHQGFLTYWGEEVMKLMDEGLSQQEAIDEITSLLNNMSAVKAEVENLIGEINLLDDDASNDGFLTYWAEQAQEDGVNNVNKLLSNMEELRPHVENLVGPMDLLDEDYGDNGLLTFWAEYAQENSLEKATNIVDNMVAVRDEVESLIGPVDFYDNQYGDNGFITYWAEYALEEGVNQVESLLVNMKSVRAEVEDLIGEVDFFDENYEDNGFITFWAEYAQKNNVQEAKNILSNMNSILGSDWDNNGTPELEELIGEIDFFDNRYGDNGFLTYWAEKGEEIGIDKVKRKLYIWKRLLPAVEEEEGTLDLFNPEDSGILSFWTSEVETLIQEEGLDLEEAINQIINQISPTTTSTLLSEVSDNVASFFLTKALV